GCIRDILGCGLGGKPIATTDVFCVGEREVSDGGATLCEAVSRQRTLMGLVGGVRDYTNRAGVPTINGAVHVDPGYARNPLVFCGCVGLLSRSHVHKQTRAGDRIVLLGGKTGVDGVGGGSFSSASLATDDEHATA